MPFSYVSIVIWFRIAADIFWTVFPRLVFQELVFTIISITVSFWIGGVGRKFSRYNIGRALTLKLSFDQLIS